MIPFIQIGSLQLPTFFLVISLSVSALLVFLSVRVDSFLRNRTDAFNLALIIMVSGFIGGRLLHVFYEDFDYYKTDPIRILYFWQGGFVFFGGVLLAWLCCFLYCRHYKISFMEWADFLAPLLSLSHALGRIGCVLTGCCFGQSCDLPWAVAGRHPTALYLAGGEFLIFLGLLTLEKFSTKLKLRTGEIFFFWILLHSLLRFIVEYYRDDFRGYFFHLPVLGALSVSQMLCLVLIITAAVKIFKLRRLSAG